jgi:hypothetical protein
LFSVHRQSLQRVRAALDRPRLWKATAVLAAVALCVLLVGAAQGSISVVDRAPAATARGAASWERGCTRGSVRLDRNRLAFCARVDGIVVTSSTGPDPGEVHAAVIGGFHLTIVKLPDGTTVPSLGSHLVAVGPLLRARDGQREVQAFEVGR